ncbi:MAG: SHD1 domain-containing protein [Planctomycetota bacterium]
MVLLPQAWRCGLAPLLVLGLVMAASAAAVADNELRTWTDGTGKYTIRGTFKGESGGSVSLMREDGQEVRIPLEKLSAADQKLVAELKAAAQGNPFEVVEDAGLLPADGAEAAPPAPTAGSTEPRVVRVDWSKAREIALPLGDLGWRLAVQQPEPAVPAVKPVTIPPLAKFGEGLQQIVVNAPPTRVLLSYGSRHRDAEPIRLVIVDPVAGRAGAARAPAGTPKMMPLGLNTAGDKLFLRTDEFGFGKSRDAEIWSLSNSGVRRLLRWTASEATTRTSGSDGDIQWGCCLPDERVATLSKGGRLVVWDAATAQPLYSVRVPNRCLPALSSDGRYLCLGTDSHVYLFDTQRQQFVAARVHDDRTLARLHFSPDGSQLLLVGTTRMQTIDFGTGKALLDCRMPEHMLVTTHVEGGSEFFICPNHVLLRGTSLLDLRHQTICWQYKSLAAANPFGPLFCMVAQDPFGRESGRVWFTQLPPPDVEQKVAALTSKPDFWALRPGTKVSIEVAPLPDKAQRENVRGVLEEKCKAEGFHVVADAEVRLVALIEENPERRKVAYSMSPGFFPSPFRGGKEYEIREFYSVLRIDYKGTTAWERRASSVPQSLRVSDDESMLDVLREHEKPNYKHFSTFRLPHQLANPHYSTIVGATEVTPTGLHPSAVMELKPSAPKRPPATSKSKDREA